MMNDIILNAIREDTGSGDVTSDALIPEDRTCRASILAKGNIVLSGMYVCRHVFHLVDGDITFTVLKKDGAKVKKGAVMAKIKGSTRSILTAERTALNLLQRLSGIATLTSRYVNEIRGCSAKITDTRKTAPGLRCLDKYAVRTGGGVSHRFGLFDGVIIKDNHLKAAGGIAKAVKKAKARVHHLMKIEVEVSDLKGVKEAVSAGADAIMLDNMQHGAMQKAVRFIRERSNTTVIEASGNIHLSNVRKIAETGVDLISVGALTHSVSAADISLTFD